MNKSLQILSWTRLYNHKNYFRVKELNKVIKENNKRDLGLNLFRMMSPLSKKASRQVIETFMRFYKKNLLITKNSSILDYGSGTGWIIFNLQKYKICNRFISKDVSKVFITNQKKIINNCKFEVVKPNKWRINEKTSSVDWVISNAVFHCFKNRKFTKKIISEMIRVSKRGLLITNILDYEKKKEFIKYKLFNEKITSLEFKKKYKFTSHLFHSKKFFNFLKKNKYKYSIIKMPNNKQYSKFHFALKILK